MTTTTTPTATAVVVLYCRACWHVTTVCLYPRGVPGQQLRSVTRSPASALILPLLLSLLQLEKAQKDPARVQLLYERAVSVFPVTSELWLQYTRYLETELKVPTLINQV